MKIISIDIETTGLDPEYCQVIEFAAIYDDLAKPACDLTELPVFHRYVMHERYQGDPVAIHMHADYFAKRANLGKGEPWDQWVVSSQLMDRFYDWLDEINYPEKIIVAGKNFQGFDQRFLSKLIGYDDEIRTEYGMGKRSRKWHHRTIDPTVLYTNFKLDVEPPSLDACWSRITSVPRKVKHTALQDARDVLTLIREKMN